MRKDVKIPIDNLIVNQKLPPGTRKRHTIASNVLSVQENLAHKQQYKPGQE